MQKFEILTHSVDDSSYFYNYISHTWIVISVKTGDELYTFSGSYDADRSGIRSSGVKEVKINDEENILTIVHSDDSEEEIILPTDVVFINNAQAIQLEWPDGKKETRPRTQPIFTSKYGEPFSPVKLKFPDNE